MNRWRLPKLSVLESLTEISFLIAFDQHDNSEVLEGLQSTWQKVLGSLFFIHEDETGVPGKLRRHLRNGVVAVIARTLVEILARLYRSYSQVRIPELQRFYQQDEDQLQLYRNLLPYLDPNHGSLEEIRNELMQLAKSRDIMIQLLLWLVLAGYGAERKHEVYDIMKEMFQTALGIDPPGPVALSVLAALMHVITEYDDTEAQALFSDLVWRFYERSECTYATEIAEYQHNFIDTMITSHFQVGGTDFPTQFIENLELCESDLTYTLHRMITTGTRGQQLPFCCLDMMCGQGYFYLALKVAERLLRADDPLTEQGIYRFLARNRYRYGEEIDSFIDSVGRNRGILKRTMADVKAQDISTDVYLNTVPFLFSARAHPAFFNEINGLFRDFPACKSITQVAALIIKRFVNFIYGDAVFDPWDSI